MIKKIDNYFKLDTRNTSYIFEINGAGIAEHLYYGPYIDTQDVAFLRQKREFEPGSTLLMDVDYLGFSLEDALLEMSSCGKGDIREPLLEVTHADGSITSDFRFESFVIDREKKPLETLPASYDDLGEVEHLLAQPLEVGKTVCGEIDWARRFDLMQQHSGEHIVSGIICGSFGCDNV